jgi:hypothetical protein
MANELIVWSRDEDTKFPPEHMHRIARCPGFELSIRRTENYRSSKDSYLGEIFEDLYETDFPDRKRLVALRFPMMREAKEYLESRVRQLASLGGRSRRGAVQWRIS